MNKYQKNDKTLKATTLAISVLFLGFALYLLSVFVFKNNKLYVSEIPSLNATAAERLDDLYGKRTNISTNGKPNITNIIIGNDEPF